MRITPDIRKQIGELARVVALLLGGAWLMLCYLEWSLPDIHDRVRSLDHGLFWAVLAISQLANALRGISSAVAAPSPRMSGTITVILIGLAVTVGVHQSMPAGQVLIGDAAALLATILLAVVVWRFASRFADDIGEARFSAKP